MRARSALVLIVICAAIAAYFLNGQRSPATNGPGRGGSNTTSAGPGQFSSVAADLVFVDSTLGEQQEQAAGTGVVLTSTGEVLTNNHVIEGATAVQVTDVGNGRTYTA